MIALADHRSEIERDNGEGNLGEQGAEGSGEIEPHHGTLLALTSSWRDVQQTRLAVTQRGQDDFSATLKAIEDRMGREIGKELRRDPVWPWLSQYPGLGGVHTARLIALIGDPHRFPGRVCGAGHHHSTADGRDEIEARSGCGVTLADETVCTEQIGPVRRGTGTRSLWHYLGLHVVDGKLPRKARGVQADWNPAGRTACLMPGGLAEQIVRLRVPTYRESYDAAKARLIDERGVVNVSAIETGSGPALIDGPEVVRGAAIDTVCGLRPIQIEKIARTIAVKAFVGDLLRELKRVS